MIISYVPGRFTQCVTDFTAQRKAYSRTFHLTRDAAGKWRKVEIPVPNEAFGRSRIVFDKADNAYVIMPFGRIVAASKAAAGPTGSCCSTAPTTPATARSTPSARSSSTTPGSPPTASCP